MSRKIDLEKKMAYSKELLCRGYGTEHFCARYMEMWACPSWSKYPSPLTSLVWANVLKKQKAASNMNYRQICNTNW